MLRSSVLGLGLAVTALLAVQLGGCSSSGGGGGKGGTTGTGGSSSPGTGGSSSPGTGGTGGTSAGGTGGTSAGGTGGTSAGGKGGSTGGTGGASAGGTGGSSAGGKGGSTGGTGGASTGGTGGASAGGTGGSATGGTGGSATGGTGGSGTGGTPGFGQPACPGTVAKGLGCAPSDPQLCYKNCGPQNIGRKSETCSPNPDGGITDGGTTSSYAEMTGCSFDPAGSYTCYKIPTTANAACPAPDGGTGTFAVPQASQACAITDMCTLCNSLGGLATGQYMDSSANLKTGYCTCIASKWNCASDTAWPCGTGANATYPGCQ